MTRRQVPWRRSGGLAAGLAVVSLILAGCVNLPSGGDLSKVKQLPNSVGSQIGITPRAPGPQWDTQDIVSGFLLASGANPDDLRIASEYLTKKYAKAWRPSSTPQVIDTGSKLNTSVISSHVTGGQSSAQVTVTSYHLEELVVAGANEAGRLQKTSGPAPYTFTFELLRVDGKWRIDSIMLPNGKSSDSILLLTGADFERDYLPRNLYYLASGSPQTLVPYPVYVPAQTGQLGGVRQLVDAVRTTPTKSNWLYNAITTALPRRIKPNVQVQGSRAVVGFGAVSIDPTKLKQMEAQLVWTLTYAPDSPGGTGISSVQLDIGHKQEVLLQSKFKSWVPQGPSGPLFYQTLNQVGNPTLEAFTPNSGFGSPSTGQTGGTGKTHRLAGGSPVPGPPPAGLGRGLFTAVAISPAPALGVRYFAGCRGTTAYIAPMLPITDLESRDLPGKCTSLSWDNHGDCWAVAGSDVYVLNATVTTVMVRVVSIPALQIQPDNFVSLKVAPDGLRVAMIVRSKHGASVYVSAITKKSSIVYLAQGGPVLTAGPDLLNPIALTWWDSNHLLVLERQHGVSQLYEVPVNGGASIKVLTPPDATSVTANGMFVAVGTPASRGQGQPTVLASHGLNGSWAPVGPGSTPTYVG